MTRSLALIFCMACLLRSHSASAKPRIALTEIVGDATGDVRDAVADALAGGELLLIGNFAVDRAIGKLGDSEVMELTEKDLKQLASELAADAIVSGKLSRVGAARTLKFRVFVGKKLAKGFTMSFKDPRSEKLRAVLHEKMLARFGISADEDNKPARKPRAEAEADDEDVKARRKARAEADPADDEDKKPRRKAKAEAEADDEEATARPAKKAASEKDGEAEDEAEASDEPARGRASAEGEAEDAAEDANAEDAPRRGRKKVAVAETEDGLVAEPTADARRSRSAGSGGDRRAVQIAAGPSVLQRSLIFVASDIPNKPRNVTLSPVAGFYTDGEIYPFALAGQSGFGAGLGLGFEFEQQAGARVQVANTMTTIPFTQYRYSVGVRMRFMFGNSDTSPSLTLRAGYGRRNVTADPRQLTDATAQASAVRDTPPIIYTVIDPGATFRLPVTGRLALTLAARAMIVTDAGPIQTAKLYGAARVYGAAGTAAVDIKVASRFALQIAGEFSQMGFAFQGGGALATQLDGNAATKDVGGLTDRTLGGWATLGVTY